MDVRDHTGPLPPKLLPADCAWRGRVTSPAAPTLPSPISNTTLHYFSHCLLPTLPSLSLLACVRARELERPFSLPTALSLLPRASPLPPRLAPHPLGAPDAAAAVLESPGCPPPCRAPSLAALHTLFLGGDGQPAPFQGGA